MPFELAHVEVMVKTLLLEQAVMCAAFDDLSVVDDQRLVGVADGGKTMRNDGEQLARPGSRDLSRQRR